ncbi:lipoyl(octanoyl) transferase LipB [Chloroflexota bacterium]
MSLTIYKLGLTGYSEARSLQRELIDKRAGGEIPDTLLLLEHPPTITIGKSGKIENVLVSRDELAWKEIPLFFVDRGGDVTYHGPGQLVGYPIIDLKNRKRDLHKYVRDVEEVIIRTLAEYTIKAARDGGHAGVWVNGEEIAAVGLRVIRWVSMHGFALNVNIDLDSFNLINPCGLANGRATSISRVFGEEIEVAAVTDKLISHFADVFCPQAELRDGGEI